MFLFSHLTVRSEKPTAFDLIGHLSHFDICTGKQGKNTDRRYSKSYFHIQEVVSRFSSYFICKVNKKNEMMDIC